MIISLKQKTDKKDCWANTSAGQISKCLNTPNVKQLERAVIDLCPITELCPVKKMFPD